MLQKLFLITGSYSKNVFSFFFADKGASIHEIVYKQLSGFHVTCCANFVQVCRDSVAKNVFKKKYCVLCLSLTEEIFFAESEIL